MANGWSSRGANSTVCGLPPESCDRLTDTNVTCGKVVVLPIGFEDLKTDLELHLIDREPGEYLLYPRERRTCPMDQGSVHRWFKRCLERAGLPATIKMHELRHSAADKSIGRRET
jgi:hypothetical protein